MAVLTRVVAHYRDGTILKGTTPDFVPNRPFFHVMPTHGTRTVQVQLSQLKALFFVRDLDGDPLRVDLRGFIASPRETPRGRKIAVLFPDRELVCGHSLGYSPHRAAFFIFPSDPDTNNERIYVVVAGASEIREGIEAEQLAQRLLDGEAA